MHPKHSANPDNDDDVVLLGEVAKTLGISRMTAYVWARAGDLPVRWRGGRFEMRRADLQRLRSEPLMDQGSKAE